MTELRVRLFGGLALARGEASLPTIPGATARSLLAYLLTYRDRPHTRDLLAGTFWPDQPEATARRRLSQALWLIRSTLDDVLPIDPLRTEGDTVRVDPDLPLWIDVEAFGKLGNWEIGGLGEPANSQTSQSTNLLQLSRAIELYQGDFLAGYYDDWLLVERERLREMFLAALAQLVAGYKRRGDYERALIHARRLAGEDPWREEAHREVMRLCHLLGRDAEALAQYETCRQILAEELDAEPGPETAALAAEIARSAPVEAPPHLPAAPPAPVDADLFPAPLVGREKERAALLAHLEAAIGGLGGLVLVEGGAGVGKTRLLQELARDAEWRDMEVLWGHSREMAGTAPFAPWVEALQSVLTPLRAEQWAQLVEPIWLQVLHPLLPGLAAVAPDPAPTLKPERERERLVAAFAQLLAAWSRHVPLLLVLEDLHWADEGSLDLLAALSRRLAGCQVLIAGSLRGGEARARPAVWERLGALPPAGLRGRLTLDRLDAEASGELIRRSLGMKLAAPLFETRLHRETGGNPLFILEGLRALQDEGLLRRDDAGRWRTPWDATTSDYAEVPLPPAVERVIARRLAHQAPPERSLLETAAVLGGELDFGLLRAASSLEADALLPALHTLVRRHFLVEGPAAYEFSHDQIRQAAYRALDAEARRAGHRRAAEALAALHPHRVAALAHHAFQGEVWDRAAEYHQQAGDRARAVHANAEAEDHYTAALAALARLPDSPDPARLFALRLARETVRGRLARRDAQAEDLAALESLAETLDDPGSRAELAWRRANYAEVTGDYPAAIEAARKAVALAQSAGTPSLAAAARLLWGRSLWREGDGEAARAQLELALAQAVELDLHDVRADSLRNLGTQAFYQGDYPRAGDYYGQALALYRQIGDRLGESVTLNNVGTVLHCQGQTDEARAYYERVLHLKRELDDRRGEGLVLNNLGSGALNQGDYPRARAYLEQALPIMREIADRHAEGVVLSNLGVVVGNLGDLDRAGAYHRQALELFCQIGNRLGEGEARVNLALLAHQQGDDRAARQYSRQSLEIAQELEDQAMAGYAWTNLGHALAGLGRPAEATGAYRQAISIRRELDERNLAVESLAGLVRVQHGQGDLDGARAGVEDILDHLETHTLVGVEEPLRVYLTCYRVLHAAGDPRARRVLHAAHQHLSARADALQDEAERRSFMENVAAHRQIVAAWEAFQPRQTTVRLPPADAPPGHPLGDDEYVTVTWTLEAPEDEAIAGKVARRRVRLRRLLREAAEQGAAPTVDDLAAALEVSYSTLKRDLAALRQAGYEAKTWGSR